ncbi:hypothetical protein [Aliidiomarina celeris]|uniref:hypothetical protein n=1 Tax=Aliidiomarina celeris TaxID=2249428 RepID=UPI000DE9A8EE|nr:hypothetical protein [Aliidiomarina celeris]
MNNDNHNSDTTAQNNEKNIKLSACEVYFEHQGRTIKLWFSSFSGKEEIYINGELVSHSRSWRFKNTHRFTYEGTNYEVEVGVRNWKCLFQGIYYIELRANGLLIDQDEINYMLTLGAMEDKKGKEKFSWRKFLLSLLPFFLFGAGVGFVVGFFS